MAKRKSNGIDVNALNQEVDDLGVRIKISRATVCPNIKSIESMDHDINCTVCNNNMIDFGCKESIGLMQQQDLVEKFKIEGTFNMDEVLMTFKSDITLHIFSRIEILDFAEDFFELIQRQEATSVDKLKYPACSVLAIFTVAGNVKTEYFEGADFQIDINGNLKWTGTHKPADRDVYSIYYQHHPVFRAVRALHRDRYSQYNLRPETIESPKKTVGDKTFVKLPETWILKRDYLVERRDLTGALIPDNEYYDPNE